MPLKKDIVRMAGRETVDQSGAREKGKNQQNKRDEATRFSQRVDHGRSRILNDKMLEGRGSPVESKKL